MVGSEGIGSSDEPLAETSLFLPATVARALPEVKIRIWSTVWTCGSMQ